MNEIFHEDLDKFVVVYLDDIVVYSSTLEEHVGHLKTVFELLKKNHLSRKRSVLSPRNASHSWAMSWVQDK